MIRLRNITSGLRRLSIFVVVLVFVTDTPLRLRAQQTAALTNEAVVELVRWKATDAEIIAIINRNWGTFELTAATMSALRNSGVSDQVLDAMYHATKLISVKRTADGSTSAQESGEKGNTGIESAAPTPAPESSPGKNSGIVFSANSTTATPATSPKIPPHSDSRLTQAQTAGDFKGNNKPPDASTISPFLSPCSPDNSGKVPKQSISLFWPSGSSDPTHIYQSGSVCFELKEFNDILYTASFTLTETVPSGSAFDYLKDAIGTVTSAFTSGQKTGTTEQKGKCPTGVANSIAYAVVTASRFKDAMSQLDPGKDASGKVLLVDLHTTLSKWQPIPDLFNQFWYGVQGAYNALNLPPAQLKECSDDLLATAEALILDTYPTSKNIYSNFVSHVKSDHTLRFTSHVTSTDDYVATVQAIHPSGDVSNGARTFTLKAGHKILSSSGGFLISELPARSYQSVTVPSGKSTPATQNVLGIDNFSGPRVGVTALLNIYIPDIPLKHGNRIPLNGRNWGLALSGGPTYAVSGNSADTSQWGLLFGPTVHIRNQFFVTPGVNIGQFADFPLGYTRAGQIIPANTGTPNPVKRYTARFAVGVTYKIKDFGQGTGQNNAGAAPQAGAANASGGNTKGSGPDKPATQAGNSY